MSVWKLWKYRHESHCISIISILAHGLLLRQRAKKKQYGHQIDNHTAKCLHIAPVPSASWETQSLLIRRWVVSKFVCLPYVNTDAKICPSYCLTKSFMRRRSYKKRRPLYFSERRTSYRWVRSGCQFHYEIGYGSPSSRSKSLAEQDQLLLCSLVKALPERFLRVFFSRFLFCDNRRASIRHREKLVHKSRAWMIGVSWAPCAKEMRINEGWQGQVRTLLWQFYS